jgi:hypothetical protein
MTYISLKNDIAYAERHSVHLNKKKIDLTQEYKILQGIWSTLTQPKRLNALAEKYLTVKNTSKKNHTTWKKIKEYQAHHPLKDLSKKNIDKNEI